MWEIRSIINPNNQNVFVYQIVNKLPISNCSISDIKVVAYQNKSFNESIQYIQRESLMSEIFMHSNSSSTISSEGMVNILSVFHFSVQEENVMSK